MDKNVKNWVATSNYDIQTAEAMYKAGRYLYVVFMCHLAMEKILKALLANKNPEEIPPKIHNLINLAQRAGIKPPENLRDFFQRIDNVSIAIRYPEDLRTLSNEFNQDRAKRILADTKKDAKMAQTTAKVRSIVARYIENLNNMGVPVDRVYLFGSQARLDAGKDSDLDLAVISPLFEKMSLWDRAGYLGKAAWGIPYPMDVIGFAPSQVRKAMPGTLLCHILKTGIQISQ